MKVNLTIKHSNQLTGAWEIRATAGDYEIHPDEIDRCRGDLLAIIEAQLRENKVHAQIVATADGAEILRHEGAVQLTDAADIFGYGQKMMQSAEHRSALRVLTERRDELSDEQPDSDSDPTADDSSTAPQEDVVEGTDPGTEP